MLLAELATASGAVAAVSGRRAKVELLAAALTALAVGGDAGQIEAGAAYLAGEPRQRQLGVGWAGLRDRPAPALEPTLTVTEVDARLAAIAAVAGQGSQARRRVLVGELFAAATVDEQRFLAAIISGELRQGALAGLLADALAKAAGVEAGAVRRALLLRGDLKQVAVLALTTGALGGLALTVGRPLAPMLASAAASVDEALAATGVPAAVDAKLDGIRIQVHRDGDEIAVFSRSLDDITPRVPSVVAAVRDLGVRRAVLDGEALALGEDGRARPFQETTSRGVTLRPFFFDALHLDGADLIDAPASTRWAALDDALPPALRVGRVLVDDAASGQAAFAAALASGQAAFAASLAAGHEGVVIKAATSVYDVGRRGAAWVKVKPRHTLDLVVLAAEWGHGRRRGYLSNLHLGARSETGWVMLGKTFKGLTDAMLAWQTERLLSLSVERGEWVVTVRPELVVEIAFDGVQASTRYPGGVTLRFARVLRYREDKDAAQADTLDAVRSLRRG